MSGTHLPFISLTVDEPLYDGTLDTISEIPIDVRISTGYNFSAEITSSPVEEGAEVSDHRHKKPTAITLEGLVSDTPIVSAATEMPDLRGDASYRAAPGSRAIGAHQAIMMVHEKSLPLTVITELGIFEDMLIEQYNTTRSKDRGGDALWFTLALKKIATVKTLTAALPPDVVARLKRRRAKTKRARKEKPKIAKDTAQIAKQVDAGTVKPEQARTTLASQSSAAGAKHTAAYGKTP